MKRLVIGGHCVKPARQPGVLVGKQRDQAGLRRPFDAQSLQENALCFGVLLKLPTAFQKTRLTQQAAGSLLEAREKEIFLHVLVFDRRQAVATDHPVLGAQIIEVHPQGCGLARGHRIHVGARQLTGKRSDHHVGGFGGRPLPGPVTHLHALLPLLGQGDVDFRAQSTTVQKISQRTVIPDSLWQRPDCPE
ncbi:hypothetical protein D3C76_1065670 [compost metagenome]